MPKSPMLDDATFATVIQNTPLVSIDLIIMSPDNRKVLLGQRKNEPAQNYWFAYGGRILKDERLAQAVQRVSEAELRLALNRNDGEFIGVFEHIYDRNFFEHGEFGTHYVVLAHKFVLAEDPPVIPDGQHRDHRWWTVTELLEAPDVHPNTKAYFSSEWLV